jgi:hypothetical protein
MSNNTGHSTEKTAGNRRTLTQVSPHLSPLLTVLVVAGDGRLLNPCHPARARELIRKQRAIRISRHPYTIRLLDVTRHEVDAIPIQQEPS